MNEKHAPEVRFAEFSDEWTNTLLGNELEIWSVARVHKDE